MFRKSMLFVLPLCLLLLFTAGYAQTDITNSGGTITAQYTDSPSGEDIAKLIDNSTSTKYLTFHASGWVQFQASAGAVVTSYTITSANDAAERDPKNFNLQGSNNGTSWTTLNTQSNQTFASRFLKKTYSFTNSTSYTYYRLNVTAVQSGTTMQMAEWELLAGSTPPTGVVTVYKDINYAGASQGYAVGTYTTAQMVAKGTVNNDVSSVKVTAGYKVTFYDSDNFTGTAVTKTADDATLVDDSFNDMASSMRVEVATTTPDFTLSRSPSSLTFNQGSSGTSTITVNKLNGFNSSVSLSASGMGTGVTASFNPTSTTGTSTLTLTASSSAATGTRTVTVTGVSGSLTRTTTISLTVNTSGGTTPPASWTEHWFEHNQVLSRVFYDNDVAVYFDPDMNRSITWMNTLCGNMWRYSKQTYGSMQSGGDGRLYAIFHQGRYGGGHPSYWYDASHDNRNVEDIGAGPWDSQSGWALDATVHEVGHIVESTPHGLRNSPCFGIWGDSKWCEIYNYDVYVALGLTSDASRWYTEKMATTDNFPQAGTKWFQNWFYPIWNTYGRGAVLDRFMALLGQYTPSSSINLGEFVYFWSGATGTSQKSRATTAFGWTTTTNSQWTTAYTKFPNITFTGKDVDAAVAPAPAVVTTGLNSVGPNPCTNLATIKYQLKNAARVKMTVFNALGQHVETLVNSNKSAGPQTATWNVQNVSGGVYYIKLEAGNTVSTQKAIVAK